MFRICLLLIILAVAFDGRYSWRKILKSLTDGDLISSIPEKLLQPESGSKVLPIEVREAKTLLQRNSIQHYNLNSDIVREITYQRYIEGLWPRRHTPEKSQGMVIAQTNNPPHNCEQLDRETRIGLFRCL